LNFYAETCQKFGMRPWMWSDKIWHTSDEEYSQNVPRYILQSNWDYGNDFKKHLRNDGTKGFPDIVEAYFRLERLGYDQVPTASNWAKDENYEETVRHLSKMLSSDKLLGFMQTPWKPTLQKYKQDILQSISLMDEAHRLNPDA